MRSYLARVVSRLSSLLFLAVFLVLAISSVRAGDALWAVFYGVVLGLWLAAYLVEFLAWRKRRKVKARVVAALLDGDDARLRILK